MKINQLNTANKLTFSIEEISELLSMHTLKVEEQLQKYVDGARLDNADVLIVVGGDGTILRACKQYGDIPLLTVNMGTYGFLSEVTPDTIEQIPSLLESHVIDTRSKLKVTYKGKLLGHVLNEVVVRSTSPIKMDHLLIGVDSESIDLYGDGVIVATPTGSTAYSLSAGGSILHSDSQVLIVTPICPLFRESHPYVVPDSKRISVTNLSKESYIILDGQPVDIMSDGDHIELSLSEQKSRFIRRTI